MHALISGGAGFVGSHLVDCLLDEGWSVTIVDNFDTYYDPAVKRRNIESCLLSSRFRVVETDICDPLGLRQQLSGGYDVIVHLAAKAGVRQSLLTPSEYVRVNSEGTQNMLEYARENGISQFVFASSSSAYGTNTNVPWQECDRELLPISPYAASKIAGELLGYVYSQVHGIRFIALRLFTVFGPRQRPDLAIHKFARLMLAGEQIPLFGSGSAQRDYTYCGDIVRGIRAAMEYTRSQNEIINLASGNPRSVLCLIEGLERALGVKARISPLPDQPGDVPRTWANIEKANQLLGYRPSMSFEAGLERFTDWLRGENGQCM